MQTNIIEEAEKIFPDFYAKLILRINSNPNDDCEEYFNDVELMALRIEEIGKLNTWQVRYCHLITKTDFDRFYLPF